MANLNESDLWETGVYQLEEDDPVLGGPTGIDNVAPRQLANRSRFQRLRNVTPWDGGLTYPANVAYVSYGGATWKSVGESTNVAPGTDGTKWTRWGHSAVELDEALDEAVAAHEAKADPHPQYATDANLNAHSAAADPHSPYALWSALAEVITAGGTVANRADTSQLLQALRNAGVFQSAPQFDVSTKVATMAALQRALGSYRSSYPIAAAIVLTADDVGKNVTFNAGGSAVLPLGSTLVAGSAVIFGSTVAGATITRQGSDLINTLTSTVTSFTLDAGDTLLLVWNGGQWVTFGGTSQFKHSASFSASLSANGYARHPSGLLVQHGAFSGSASGDTSVTFARAFSSTVLAITLGTQITNTGIFAGFNNVTTSGFTGSVWLSSSSRANGVVNYLAVGY